eukprot:TRINITY_DN3746_c0_g1_i1.p1 TRINITY_DN3746_c0_g1~~TRINITY_DN3746_c0_g1_i1.p1  ORF type:complete len:113 (+),score=9.33 TRINITY_DN3746_c0_g1_i1:240-578(+)
MNFAYTPSIVQYAEWKSKLPYHIQERGYIISEMMSVETPAFQSGGPTEIIPGFLYLGGSMDACNSSLHHSLHIDYVLCLCSSVEIKPKRPFPEFHKFLGFNAIDSDFYDLFH